jgi:uncharacterized protein YqjF (DUF2071 family)
MHWPVPSARLRLLVPPELAIQEFEGTSWVGVVPFRMESVMRRPFADVPGLSAFPELNVRLYVEAEGRPGVWFLSLDATNPLAVWAARRFFHLPYHQARMSLKQRAGWFEYESHRRSDEAGFAARYRPVGEQYESSAGTLGPWLTERYCLYALSPTGRLLRNEVHHMPWPLYRAEAELTENTLLRAAGLELPNTLPLLHFAPRVDVIIWDGEEVLSKTVVERNRAFAR